MVNVLLCLNACEITNKIFLMKRLCSSTSCTPATESMTTVSKHTTHLNNYVKHISLSIGADVAVYVVETTALLTVKKCHQPIYPLLHHPSQHIHKYYHCIIYKLLHKTTYDGIGQYF